MIKSHLLCQLSYTGTYKTHKEKRGSDFKYRICFELAVCVFLTWQGLKDSNLHRAVLETAVLPITLSPYGVDDGDRIRNLWSHNPML